MSDHSALNSTEPAQNLQQTLEKDLARCDQEIEAIKLEARNGKPDIRGILQGLHDWRTEKLLIQKEAQ